MAWKPLYVSADDVATHVRADAADPYIVQIATAASRAVDGSAHRQFGQLDVPAERVYDAARAVQLENGRWVLPIDDVQNTVGLVVTVDGTVVAAQVTADDGGYQMWPRNNGAEGRPYEGLSLATRPYGDVAVLARFGWTSVPDEVLVAVKIQANRWAVRRESPYGIAGSATEGTATTLTARLDPDARAVLASAGLIRLVLP